MNKQELFNILTESITQSDLSMFLEYSCCYGLTSSFNFIELNDLSTQLSKKVRDFPEWRMYLVDTNLCKKGDIKMFFDEISLATVNVPGEVRIMVPDGIQRHTKGMPDCLTITTETGSIQGLEFKHLKTDRISLHEFPYK